jgi:hypothetical protein
VKRKRQRAKKSVLDYAPSMHSTRLESLLRSGDRRVLDLQMGYRNADCRRVFRGVQVLNEVVTRAASEFYHSNRPMGYKRRLEDLQSTAVAINSRFAVACINSRVSPRLI